ncbi:hypothetical protein AAG906_027911 [Vitis piasezkii]
MDKLEQKLRQMRTSEGAITWEDFDGAPVAAKFGMPEIERYGIGCPRIHLRLYSTVMRAHGLDDAQMIIDRPSERDQISMIMRSLQPRFARHLMGFPHTDFGSLVQALYGIEEGIAKGLWSESSPTDSKGKRPLGGQRSGDVSAISSVEMRPSRRYQTVGQTPRYYYLITTQNLFLLHTSQRPPAPYTRPRAPQTTTYVQRPPRQFAQLGMPLSRAFQKLTEGGLLIPLASRPLPQPIPPRFRMDLHCSYHQGPGHDTDHCTALRHAIQDLIDQGLVNLGQPSVTTNPLPTHSTRAVHPSSGDIHHMDLIEDDSIHMLSWDDGLPEPIVLHDSYEVDGVSVVPQTPAPFSLIPDEAPFQLTHPTPLVIGCQDAFVPFTLWPEDDDSAGREIQIVTRSGRIAQPPPPAVRPFEGTTSHEKVRREDDEVLRQLRNTQLAFPSGATCIVFLDDDLPPNGLDHAPLYITVGCSGRRVPHRYNPWFRALDFGPSTQTIGAYDNTKREVMGTLMIDLQIGSATFSTLFPIPSSLHRRTTYLTGFTFDEIMTLEIEDFCRDFVAMSFDQHSSTVGPSEFIATIDHDTTFGLGFIPTEADYRHMARLRKERVRARLSHIPFDYPIRPYRMSLVTTLSRIETRPRLKEIDSVVHIDRDRASAFISPATLHESLSFDNYSHVSDRASMLSLCFPEEITGDGVMVDSTEMIDGVVSHDEYRDEMDMMTMTFDMFGVSTIEVFEGTQTLPVPELLEDDSSLFEGIVSPVEGASDLVDPPLSFDVLSGFVSRSDDVSVASFMDLSIFEYSPVSCDSISISAPHSPTSQIFDISDEVAWPDSDRDSFDHDSEDQPRELKIGSPLSIDERDRLIHLLRSYLDVFAWSYEDMPGLDPSIVQHHLPTLPHARPVKQKLRRLHPRWSLQVKEEIQKQLSVGFISVVEYPEWLANVVPVPKKDGKVRVCVDFRDLNKASPKDDFPLPHIDLLVDGTAGHSMLSFMDGFSGYNQILMAPEDMEKTAFITEWGATYQRAATTLFHDMMHRDVEVYVDDMIVKSRGRADHLDALERFFERIQKFRLRLNPKKCTFGVTSGKLLGHMVSERGIEVDPDKIKAILDMPAPKTEKEIRGFLGRLQYISRFIARLTDICEPIFRLLRKNQPTVWNDDCQFAFEKIKEYLLSPPVLVPPTPDASTSSIFVVSDMALGCITSLGYRRLRHYMTSIRHLISRLDPLRYLFDRPALTGRLMRWLVLLTEFDIQPVDDDFPDEEFVAMTSLSGWCLYFDGAANQLGYGIGVLLVSPQGDHIPRSVRLAFHDRHPITNNIVEYEACILGLETALELGIRQMELLVARFDDLRYVHLPRAQNRFADALATLASSVDIPIDVIIVHSIESSDGMLLLCLDRASADRVMREVHAGVCGPHMGGHMLASKIMRTGYFWLTMETDCCQFVQKCPECQIHGDLIHAPPSELHALTSPWPFSIWGIDIIGKVSPKSSNGHEFILVAIDYFTKWVKAASYARLTSTRVAALLDHTSFVAMGFLMS